MKRILILLLILLLPAACAERTREEVRAAYHALTFSEGSPYAELPAVTAPYGAGALTDSVRTEAADYLNFLRWLAGVEPVSDSAIYDYQCQRAAVLLAALDYVDHNAPMPEDMDVNFYDAAHLGTSSGNIARFNWMRDSIVREGVAYFVRDDGEANLPMLGHRRWALDPLMAATGFGLANAESGMSYVVMYAHDLGNPDAQWDSVLWPSPGAFPAELMHDHLAWSAVLNPREYDLAASPVTVTLTEPELGLTFRFDPVSGSGDGFCALNLEPYGAGGCVIFRPDFTGTGFTDYQQNQCWRVRLDGLTRADGSETYLDYEVDMVSLVVQDAVNIEISQLEAALRPGETLALDADVIPAYADDLTVAWSSTDSAVAAVDQHGGVTAVAPGACQILCRDAAGHEDSCVVTVE